MSGNGGASNGDLALGRCAQGISLAELGNRLMTCDSQAACSNGYIQFNMILPIEMSDGESTLTVSQIGQFIADNANPLAMAYNVLDHVKIHQWGVSSFRNGAKVLRVVAAVNEEVVKPMTSCLVKVPAQHQ